MPHVCPWWVGYFLVSPLRRWRQDPQKILSPYIEPGMTVLDAGSGMGFFSLDMARLAGPEGKTVCFDVQGKMLAGLRRRAKRAGLLERIDVRLCDGDGLAADDLAGRIDFFLAFYMVHETPDAGRFLRDAAGLLKPGGRLLIAEPEGHVTPADFEKTLATAREAGLNRIGAPAIYKSRTALFEKPASAA